MDTSLSWIKAYVPDLDCHGTGIYRCNDIVRNKGRGIHESLIRISTRSLLVKINKIEKHPDADKLVICQVQINEEGESSSDRNRSTKCQRR